MATALPLIGDEHCPLRELWHTLEIPLGKERLERREHFHHHQMLKTLAMQLFGAAHPPPPGG